MICCGHSIFYGHRSPKKSRGTSSNQSGPVDMNDVAMDVPVRHDERQSPNASVLVENVTSDIDNNNVMALIPLDIVCAPRTRAKNALYELAEQSNALNRKSHMKFHLSGTEKSRTTSTTLVAHGKISVNENMADNSPECFGFPSARNKYPDRLDDWVNYDRQALRRRENDSLGYPEPETFVQPR